jgi:hypothetical protein
MTALQNELVLADMQKLHVIKRSLRKDSTAHQREQDAAN